MARWPRGEADVERLVRLGHLQQVTGAAADGTNLLAKARRTLATAETIAFAVEDSTVTIFADGASAMWWTVDGLARQEAVGTALYRTRAEWKKDALVLERGRVTGRDTQRRFRLLKDGRLELTFPGIRRHPDYPGKYLFERVRPAAKP